jgi:hypothetical protein
VGSTGPQFGEHRVRKGGSFKVDEALRLAHGKIFQNERIETPVVDPMPSPMTRTMANVNPGR